MRAWPIFILVLAAVAPLAGAAVPAPLPVACVPTCTVYATALAYAPAAIVVGSGATLSIEAVDTTHTFSYESDGCLNFYITASQDFGLRITSEGSLEVDAGFGQRCLVAATPETDGSFVLPIHCQLHPAQQAILVVRPEASS